MRRLRLSPLRPRVSGTVSPVTEDSVPEPKRTRRQRRQDKKLSRQDSVLRAGDTPSWVDQFRRWGVPVSAVLVLVLCAPGEQHLASLSGWHGWISWGMAGLFTLYAGLAAIISTQLPEGAKGKTSSVWGAVFSLGLAMGAQPVAHLFVTGWLTATPRPPIELVITVSSVPPLILGHLLHFAAMPPRRPVTPDPEIKLPSRGRTWLEPVYLQGVTGMPIRYEEIERAKHSPVVYFVQNGDRIKIGTTQCVTERIGNLSLRPDDIRLILHGGRGFEQDMHELFEADRIGTTEWFTVSPEIMSFVRARTGQPFPHQTPGTTVTRIRPRPAPRPAPVLSPRPVSPAQPSRPVLTTGTAGRFTGQGAPSMSSRALSLFEDGLPEDKVRDTLRAEYLSPDGTPPKANTINKAVTRAKDKLSLRP